MFWMPAPSQIFEDSTQEFPTRQAPHPAFRNSQKYPRTENDLGFLTMLSITAMLGNCRAPSSLCSLVCLGIKIRFPDLWYKLKICFVIHFEWQFPFVISQEDLTTPRPVPFSSHFLEQSQNLHHGTHTPRSACPSCSSQHHTVVFLTSFIFCSFPLCSLPSSHTDLTSVPLTGWPAPASGPLQQLFPGMFLFQMSLYLPQRRSSLITLFKNCNFPYLFPFWALVQFSGVLITC